MADCDDLSQLWHCPTGSPPLKGDTMLTLAMQKAHRFDRAIRTRNGIECVTALVMAVLFGRWGWHAPNTLMSAGMWVVSASMLWIIFFILRYGRETASPAPNQTLTDFQQALLQKYDYQIRLLRNVKYWYLLPPYAGLLLVSAGMISALYRARQPLWPVYIAVVVYTLVFAAIGWLNEVTAVGRLQRERERLASELQSAGDCT